MAYFGDTKQRRLRDDILAAIVVVAALVLVFLPAEAQEPMREGLRRTVLRPFILAQGAVAQRRGIQTDVRSLRAERDSLAALTEAQRPLLEENRRLRGLLALRARAQVAFLPAELLRVGIDAGASTFFVTVGAEDGVQQGAPVVAEGGLVGIVRAVDETMSQGIDWTHPDFRASAMTADGTVYAVVEARRGQYREEDMLSLTGAPFHSDLRPGTRVVTSGRGGIYPRGIPLGTVVGIEEADTGWRKSYILRPAVRPESAGQVLVVAGGADGARPGDLSPSWYVPVTRDTAALAEAAADSAAGSD